MQFLYRAPIGLVQANLAGDIDMMNPMGAQLLMPLSENGGLDNLFTALDRVAPQVRALTQAFTDPTGITCDGLRVTLRGLADSSLNAAQANSLVVATPTTTLQVISVSVMKVDANRLMAVVSDVTVEACREQQGLERRLKIAARTDYLTNMPKRMVALEQISQAIESSRTDSSYQFAVLFINCDRLKQVNDSLGHAAGDEVLGQIASRLRTALRHDNPIALNLALENLAARLDGDEFIVLLHDLMHPNDAHTVAQRLIDITNQPYAVHGQQVHCSISMGVVVTDRTLGDANTVIQDANIAMVEAKRAGGAKYVVFQPAMRERAARRAGVEADLRRALVENELFVVYQPVVGLQGGHRFDGSVDKCAGVEALVRWRHPTRGVVPPIEFIEVAEESGLIGALGEFVLNTACHQFMQWQTTLGARAPRLLAVNLSRAQLADKTLVDVVAGILQLTGMSAQQLQLEVTESMAAQGDDMLARLHELSALKLTLALDDFGTGYSSLASLHLLPVNTLKIDQSFVAQVHSNAHHRVLVEATMLVAKSLGLSTVAEGIETLAQAQLLTQLGCEKGQGYYFSKPLLSDDLERWLVAA